MNSEFNQWILPVAHCECNELQTFSAVGRPPAGRIRRENLNSFSKTKTKKINKETKILEWDEL